MPANFCKKHNYEYDLDEEKCPYCEDEKNKVIKNPFENPPKQQERHIKFAEEVIETIESLYQAMDKAGGISYSVPAMKNMSLWDFICTAAPNKIRFMYIGPKKKEN